jgi:hypothetical protein
MSDLAVVQVPAERTVTEIVAHIAKIQDVMEKVLKEGEHYGPSFPGDKKKNLLKPGIDKLAFTFRLVPEYDVQTIEMANGHREYRVTTRYRSLSSGLIAGEGLGSCSTMEGKYRWRNSARKCPICGKEAIIKGKEEYGGGWVCFKKKDGCGANFQDGDVTIEKQESEKVENGDIADTYNTVLKIAKKRSSADAIITALAVSDIFSQDADDLEPGDAQHGEQAGGAAPKTTTAPKKSAGPAQNPFEKRMTEAKAKTIEIVTTCLPDKTPLFTSEEKEIAAKKLKSTEQKDGIILFDEKNASYLESIQQEYAKKLAERLDPEEKEEEQPEGQAGAKTFDEPIPDDIF